jgi:ABC-type polysaccharide/polyol phosphate transport system ATPase subunit
MRSNGNCSIELKDVSLLYDLYFDKTTTLKEYIINFFYRRKYVDVKVKKISALKNVSLKIDHGERVGIIGLNGSGKSTMLKVIAGLLKPSLGEIVVNGTVQPLIEIGAGFNPEFSGRENIYLNGAMLGFTKKQIREKEREIIEFSELDQFIDVPVKYYSSGMHVRLAFTIATIIRPEILILDEMLSAGDAEFVNKAKERMEKVLSAAKILILVSHDMDLIRALAKRVIVLNKGEVLFDGNAKEATDFYANITSAIIEKREEVARQERNKSSIPQYDSGLSKPIVIQEIFMNNLSYEGEKIMPENDVVFLAEFHTAIDFEQFDINLHIENKTNDGIPRFGNDFSGLDLRNFKKGHYRIKLSVYHIPFRSGLYKYYFHLMGMNGKEQVIEDSRLNTFQIIEDVKKDTLIKHEWKIDELRS